MTPCKKCKSYHIEVKYIGKGEGQIQCFNCGNNTKPSQLKEAWETWERANYVFEIPWKRVFEIPWKREPLPDWVNYVAVNESGYGYGYQEKPKRLDSIFHGKGNSIVLGKFEDFGDWRETLTKVKPHEIV